MWRREVRRGRAGQAFDFGEPGVLDGATAKSLPAHRRSRSSSLAGGERPPPAWSFGIHFTN
jgi:hypothetical protein